MSRGAAQGNCTHRTGLGHTTNLYSFVVRAESGVARHRGEAVARRRMQTCLDIIAIWSLCTCMYINSILITSPRKYDGKKMNSENLYVSASYACRKPQAALLALPQCAGARLRGTQTPIQPL